MNHYEILGCEQDAPLENLKRNYQRLIKQYHPDKGEEADGEKFIKIDEAWKVLRDEKSRKAYDASLLNSAYKDNQIIHAEIKTSDLVFGEDNISRYRCRCGEFFEIEREVLEEEECIYECDECSNYILIVNK